MANAKLMFGFFAGMLICTVSAYAEPAQLSAIKTLEKSEKFERSQAFPNAALERPALAYTADQYRDPFQSLVKQDPNQGGMVIAESVEIKPPEFTIQGIIWGGRVPQAIMNNQVVRVGDTIQDVRISAITQKGVTFVFMEREYKVPAPASQEESEKKS